MHRRQALRFRPNSRHQRHHNQQTHPFPPLQPRACHWSRQECKISRWSRGSKVTEMQSGLSPFRQTAIVCLWAQAKTHRPGSMEFFFGILAPASSLQRAESWDRSCGMWHSHRMANKWPLVWMTARSGSGGWPRRTLWPNRCRPQSRRPGQRPGRVRKWRLPPCRRRRRPAGGADSSRLGLPRW